MDMAVRGQRPVARARGAAVAISVAALAYALAFAQRPGRAFTDTRIEFTIDPVRFLHAVSAMWSPTGDLGHVQSGEFIGYAFPMAPWYALAHEIGLPTWVSQRIWLGSVVAAAGLGAVYLLRELLPRRLELAQLLAGSLFVANPYVIVVMGRTSAWLCVYAVLPWLLLATCRGLRSGHRWRWPAVIALLFCVGNGGVNAALLFWVALAPLALLVYEGAVVRTTTWRAAGGFLVRTVLCSALASLWWVVPVLLNTRYAPNFLPFTEQPITFLATPSASEVMRLLGYWQIYFGIGSGAGAPSVTAAASYLFDPAVIVTSFLVPLIAFAGFAWSRRWIYAPFFVLLAAVTMIVMALGFPPASFANRVFTDVYYHVGLLQVLRTTWKAAPLLALSLACLFGVAIQSLTDALRSQRGVHVAGVRVPRWSLLAVLPVVALWALPMFKGTAIDASAAYGSVPSYWRSSLRDATRVTDPNQRIMILPGELSGSYRWGDTVDSVAAFLTSRRLTIREIARFSDQRSGELQAAIDDLVQQNRLVPNQLEPLLQLLGVGAVLIPTDGDLQRSGALDPADVAAALRGQRLFAAPARRYGQTRSFIPAAGRGGGVASLPDMRRYDLPRSSPGAVRVQPFAATTVLDGDGAGVTELAAAGLLNPRRAVVYAGDITRSELRSLTGAGAPLVFTDSNRLRTVASSSIVEDAGPTLERGDPIAADTPRYDLFPHRGAAAETVASYAGLTDLRTPAPHRTSGLLPEDGPAAAVDGRLDTAWVADSQLPPADRYLELALKSARAVPWIRLHPLIEPLGNTTAVAISVNGGPERKVTLAPGGDKIVLDARALRRLRIRITGVSALASAGGIAELQIPGLPVSEALSLPTDLARAGRGLDLSHDPMSVLLARATADFPSREVACPHFIQQLSPVCAADPEHTIRRIVTLPTGRSFTVAGWAGVSQGASDTSLDRLVGLSPRWRFSSSDRFEGVALRRASSAFDGDHSTAWVGRFVARTSLPWIQWSSPHALTISRMRLIAGPPQYDFPTRVRITAPSGLAQAVPVAPDGTLILPHQVRARAVRLQVLQARAPLGEVNRTRFLSAAAIAEIQVPGLHPPAPRRSGRFATACGQLAAQADGAARVALSVRGSVAALDAGAPLAFRGCGRASTLALRPGTNLVYIGSGTIMQPDHVALHSPAPLPLPAPASPALASAGTAGNSSQEGVRPAVSDSSWLVLGESYSRGWQAWCRDAAGHEYGLGVSLPIDGYANGWRIGPGCVSARMAFVPQRTANLAYLISALAAAALLAAALGIRLPARVRNRVPGLGAGRPRAVAGPGSGERWLAAPADPGVRRWPLPVAAAWGVAIGLVSGTVFSLRLGLVAAAATLMLILVGISVRRLIAIAAGAIAIIPLIYLLHPAHDDGGYSFDFSLHELAAHWVAAGALCALIGTAGLQVAWLRARDRGPGRSAFPDPAEKVR